MLALPMMGRLADASEITAVVDYCGAGGESQGLVEAGITVIQAANHDEKAIETHSANHRSTDHLLTDLLVQDPRRRPRAHIYQASPECTWHSPAGGRKKHRHREMLDMFDDYVPNAAGERSRATMMTVLGMAEAKRYPTGKPYDDTALTSAQIAELMDVGISSIYKLRSTDDAFPTPVAYVKNSPLYSETAVLEYMKMRSNRARGRRPRTRFTDAGPAPFAERIRASILAGDGKPEIDTQRALTEKLGLNSVTFGNRM